MTDPRNEIEYLRRIKYAVETIGRYEGMSFIMKNGRWVVGRLDNRDVFQGEHFAGTISELCVVIEEMATPKRRRR